MKPRPLRRSLTFWSGIFVIVFLGCAWWDSVEREVVVVRDPYSLGSASSGAFLMCESHGPPEWKILRGDISEGKELSALQRPFFLRGQGEPYPTIAEAAPQTSSMYQKWARFYRHYPSARWLLFLPYWLLLLAVALPWSGLLVWRARRIRRAAGDHHLFR